MSVFETGRVKSAAFEMILFAKLVNLLHSIAGQRVDLHYTGPVRFAAHRYEFGGARYPFDVVNRIIHRSFVVAN